MAAHPRARGATSIEDQHGAILAALDKLYEHEVPQRRSRTRLRLVTPRLAVLKADQTGEGLRLFLRSRGQDLYGAGGHLGLFAAVRAVMMARPGRRTWNQMQLAALWGDIGENESASA